MFSAGFIFRLRLGVRLVILAQGAGRSGWQSRALPSFYDRCLT